MYKQKGTALFTALLMVSIVSAIAVSLALSQRVDIYRTQQLVRSIEAEEYTKSSIYWAISVLQNPSFNPDDEKQVWPVVFNNEGLQAQLDYYNKRFDLNSLKKSEQMQTFQELVKKTEQQFPEGWALTVANQVQEWISKATFNVADPYLLLSPPYRMAHQPMQSVSEFRLIEGVSAEDFQVLAPFLSVSNGLQSFLLKTIVNKEDLELITYSLLQRNDSGGKVVVQLLWQTRGTL